MLWTKTLCLFNALAFLLTSTAQATLTPTFERGEKNVYHTSPRGIEEVCVIPAKYPDAKYSKKDKKKEIELCNYSFYDLDATQKESGLAETAQCAKENSTNPAVNIYKVKDNQNRATIKANRCEGASKIGKYKNSTSCSYTPSILGYYHMSRILGRIGKVPVSVLRTMDIETHKDLAEEGLRITAPPKGKELPLIYQTWKTVNDIINAGSASSKKDLFFTDDIQQTYGGFIVNPKDESFFSEMFTKGADRAAAFRDSNPIFALVKNSKDLNTFIASTWKAENLQKLVSMRDAGHFILLDHIMNQQDRFGNIAKTESFAYMAKDEAADSDFDLEFGDAKDLAEDTKAGLVDQSRPALKINEMVLKDNDCGVTKSNVVKTAQLLNKISHFPPKTYKKLLEFNESLNDPNKTDMNNKFFLRNLMFTKTDFDSIKKNVADAVSILQGRCVSGALKLDLDVDFYMETGKLKTGSCHLEEKKD